MNHSRTRKILQKALVWAAIAVGLSQPLGQLTGLRWLRIVGLGLASSPLPQVFHYKEIAVRVRVEARGAPGRHDVVEMTAKRFSGVPGPMIRRFPYTLPLVARMPRRMWLPLYRTGICGGGPMARALEIPFEIRWAALHIDYRSPLYPGKRSMEVHCPR